MNREELRKLVKKKMLMGLTLGLILGLLVGGLIMAPEIYKQRIKYEASTDLLMFSINVSKYCAESQNITYTELMDEYIIKNTYEMLGYDVKGRQHE